MREGYWIRELKAPLNRYIAGRTQKERDALNKPLYYNENKEHILQYHKEYNRNNKERITTYNSEYYEKNIPFLKLQQEYEELITKIQESKTRRLIAQIQFAQIVAPQQDENEEEDEKPTNVRTLKRDK